MDTTVWEELRDGQLVDEIVREVKKRLGQVERLVQVTEQESGDIVVIQQMPITILAEVALGIPKETQSSYILQSLLEGKKVYILENGLEYRRYRERAYKPLYQLYQRYEDTLRRYGVEIITDIGEIKEARSGAYATQDEAYMDLTGLRLLKESDVGRLRGTGYKTVLIDAKTIITPLANDYITNHNLTVLRV